MFIFIANTIFFVWGVALIYNGTASLLTVLVTFLNMLGMLAAAKIWEEGGKKNE